MSIALSVLDALTSSLIVILLMTGLVMLGVLLWDLLEPSTDDRPVPVAPVFHTLTDKQRRAVEMSAGMGFQTRFDYSRYGSTINDRLGKCYMLAGKACLFGRDSDHGYMPMPSAVIHGSWHGPTSENRIDHAIVLLDTGQIWEPITASIYDRAKFEEYTQWQRHQIYSVREAQSLMSTTGHYGPW
jgi:hypothetical protein